MVIFLRSTTFWGVVVVRGWLVIRVIRVIYFSSNVFTFNWTISPNLNKFSTCHANLGPSRISDVHFFYQYALQVLRKLILVSYLCFLHFFKFTIPPVIGISSICGSFERYQSITYFLQLAVFFRQQFTPVKHDKRNNYSKY